MIGRALCAALGPRGYHVHALTRRPDESLAALPNVTRFEGELPDRIDAAAFDGCSAVIHCAYTTRFRTLDDAKRVNEEGTERLLSLSRAAGVPRFVFFSTTSAHADALSYYGQSKFRLESRLDPARDLVVRPGLVISTHGGLFQRMVGAGRRDKPKLWPVPIFAGGAQPMQTIFIDELCDGVIRALDQGVTGSLTLASPERTTMRAFFERVATFTNRRALFLNVPAAIALAGFRVAERLHLPLPVSSENLLGLLSLRYWDSTADLARIGLTVRPLAATLDLLADARVN
jgi:nucleoside-diphosphate-sugar epimerase